jgi:hypothetical protein
VFGTTSLIVGRFFRNLQINSSVLNGKMHANEIEIHISAEIRVGISHLQAGMSHSQR